MVSDRCVVGLHRQHQAGPHDLAVDAHRAGAANAMLATDMRARQLQVLAQEVRQIKPRQNQRLDALAIDLERNGDVGRHSRSPGIEVRTIEQRGHTSRQQHFCEMPDASKPTPAGLPAVKLFAQRPWTRQITSLL